MVNIFSYEQTQNMIIPLCIVDNTGNENNIFVNQNINLLTLMYCFSIFIGISSKNKNEIDSIIPSLQIISNDNTQNTNYSITQKETFRQSNIKKIIMPFHLKLECCICYNELDFLKQKKYMNDIQHFKCTHYVCDSCSEKITCCPLCRSL